MAQQKQPGLSERVKKFVLAQTRQLDINKTMESEAAKARVEVIEEVLDYLTARTWRNTQPNRDCLENYTKYLEKQGSIPTYETATYTHEMYLGIAYKQLATQVGNLLNALPEEDEA